jgi:hypothetical protein
LGRKDELKMQRKGESLPLGDAKRVEQTRIEIAIEKCAAKLINEGHKKVVIGRANERDRECDRERERERGEKDMKRVDNVCRACSVRRKISNWKRRMIMKMMMMMMRYKTRAPFSNEREGEKMTMMVKMMKKSKAKEEDRETNAIDRE